ncbi:hypothetical protein K432DRAFT_411036 [Lepidopterella palustris CBS 459.81]|uniref:Uncharacterized protein n=1 Tax=Lepidopterella palustris CBS 459.81 TaxID=1314670 RepID=A0A8E2J8B9_9PEZI|nr:hypothetical protein K432DRAFT_411036 [Lepidopterella palustris CBS 459.81]
MVSHYSSKIGSHLSSELDVPPPYSVSSPALTPENDIAPRPRPRRPCSPPPRSPLTQLQRYLIEIVAYTLDADFRLVRRALGQDEPGISSSQEEVTSILADDEKKDLFRLATIILDLYQKYMTNQWNLTLDCDRAAILTAIVEPARSMYINTDYILDMISTYAEHQCDPLRRKYTMVSRYTPSRAYRALWVEELEGTLVAHARMIYIMCPNESVRLVLGHALADLQKKMGIKDLEAGDTDRWLLKSPRRPGLWKMYYTLDPS